MADNDLLILNELAESGSNLRPSIWWNTLLQRSRTLTKRPSRKDTLCGDRCARRLVCQRCRNNGNSGSRGLYRCVFPKGVTGTLAMAKDGSGALGTIMNDGIVGQARWIPVDKAIGPACIKAALLQWLFLPLSSKYRI